MAERGFLLLSATASGTGFDAAGQPLIVSGYAYRNGMVYWSGVGTGSGTLWGSPHPSMGWFPISAFAWNNTVFRNSAIISGNYGQLMATVTFLANATGHLFAQWSNR